MNILSHDVLYNIIALLDPFPLIADMITTIKYDEHLKSYIRFKLQYLLLISKDITKVCLFILSKLYNDLREYTSITLAEYNKYNIPMNVDILVIDMMHMYQHIPNFEYCIYYISNSCVKHMNVDDIFANIGKHNAIIIHLDCDDSIIRQELINELSILIEEKYPITKYYFIGQTLPCINTKYLYIGNRFKSTDCPPIAILKHYIEFNNIQYKTLQAHFSDTILLFTESSDCYNISNNILSKAKRLRDTKHYFDSSNINRAILLMNIIKKSPWISF